MSAIDDLWSLVRDGLDGFEFQRDGRIGPHAVTLSCVRAKLVVEIHGETVPNAGRDAFFAIQGYRVARYSANTLASDPEGVVSDLRARLLASLPPSQRPAMTYLRDPRAIYEKSFATVRSEARLDRFSETMAEVATRLIHACGMVDVADRLACSEGAAEIGRAALAKGAPILCDCEMVAAGIIRRRLPVANEVLVTLNEAEVPNRAARIGNTRSAAAVELWRDRIDGAVVAVGNAPTALFHLLELIDGGWPPPAIILGFPVGFVGAAESKAELARAPRGAAFITLRGRRGGSAMAAAAVNALARAS